MNIDIKIPYTTKPSMVKNTGPTFTKIDEFYYQEKLQQLNKFGNDLWATTKEADQSFLVNKVSKKLGFHNKDNIVDLALCINEDIAIMHMVN